MRSKEETSNSRLTQRKKLYNEDDNEYTSRNDKKRK